MGDGYNFVDYLNDIRTLRQLAATITHLVSDQVPIAGGQVAYDAAMRSWREVNDRMDRFENTYPGGDISAIPRPPDPF